MNQEHARKEQNEETTVDRGVGVGRPEESADGGGSRKGSKSAFPALEPWGWDAAWQAALDADSSELLPARVIRQARHIYTLITAPEAKRLEAEVSGAFAYRVAGPGEYPAAGDWVLFETEKRRIQRVLPRRTAVRRNSAGEESLEQVITANVELLFLVFGLDGGRNFTLGMLERSLLTAWNSGARPVVVLNKADLASEEHIERCRLETETNAPGVDIHVVSALRGDGLRELLSAAKPGRTVGMLGKSGVGKSALLNALV
ncbi:MAG: GTPase RsgA, partial [Spirochaetaceae bacterium]